MSAVEVDGFLSHVVSFLVDIDGFEAIDCDQQRTPRMDWFYALNQQKVGPVSEGVLVQKINSGELPRSVLVWNPGMSEWIEAQSSPLATQFSSIQPPPLPGISGKTPSSPTTRLVSEVGGLTDKVLLDLRELMPQFLMPFDEIRSFRWVKDRNLLTMAGIGLFPLLCLSLFNDLRSAYWCCVQT
jgi:hypothetical protein